MCVRSQYSSVVSYSVCVEHYGWLTSCLCRLLCLSYIYINITFNVDKSRDFIGSYHRGFSSGILDLGTSIFWLIGAGIYTEGSDYVLKPQGILLYLVCCTLKYQSEIV